MLNRMGIAGHLRAGFLAITAFVILAGGAGLFAFYDISGALTRITNQQVPSTLAAQKLARRAQVIIDSAPKLLTSERRGAFEARSRNILNDVRRLQQRLDRVDGGTLHADDELFRQAVAGLHDNLKTLTTVVSRDLTVTGKMRERLRDWDHEYQALLNLIEPSMRVRRARLDELRTGVVYFRSNSVARARANADLRKGLRTYLPLQDLRVVLAQLNDAFLAVAESQRHAAWEKARNQLETAIKRTEAIVDTIDIDTLTLIRDRLEHLRNAVSGDTSIVALQKEKILLDKKAKTLLARNQDLSGDLDAAANDLIAQTNAQIDTALENAEKTKITGSTIIFVTMVLSILSSGLILRYYVGRNVVRRLSKVRDSMLALSRGELDRPLPQPGSDEIGRMTYALTVFRDNAVRLKQRTRELQAARDQAVKSSEAKTRFLANMSHELRTPLNTVIGFSEIIENEAIGPIGNSRYRDYAHDIHISATHLLDVINDILDVAKAEAGKLDLSETTVEVRSFVDESLRLMAPRADYGNIRLEMDMPPDTPNLVADARRLRQILLNLLSNAVKFTRAGGVVRVEVCLREDGGMDLAVVDNGIGMSETEVETALAPFSQIENSFSRYAEGTGLGLPLTKYLVELHGGVFTLQSVRNQGTRIIVSLPPRRVVRSQTALPDHTGSAAS